MKNLVGDACLRIKQSSRCNQVAGTGSRQAYPKVGKSTSGGQFKAAMELGRVMVFQATDGTPLFELTVK